MAAVLEQSAFRFRNDDGSQAAATWKAAAGTNITVARDGRFRLRVAIRNTGDTARTADWQLFHSANGGAYAPIGDTANTTLPVRAADSTHLSWNEATTQQISTGTFAAGSIDEEEGYAGSVALAAGAVTELEFSLYVNPAAADGDTVDFRVYDGTWTALDAYPVVPRVTVGSAAYSGGGTITGTGGLSGTGTPAQPGGGTITGAGGLSGAGTPALAGGGTITGIGGLSGAGAVGSVLVDDGFETYPEEAWAEGSSHGPWYVDFNGFGQVLITAGRFLELAPSVVAEPNTTAALVTSTVTSTGDVTLRARMRTLSQNKGGSANGWECAWLFWNRRKDPGEGEQGTGTPSEGVERCYYLALKPNGWEIGKLDQERFTDPYGGQRFLLTGTTPTYPVGTDWHDVTVQQVGSTITATVDGVVLGSFTDGPGSGGFPGWDTHPTQEVYTHGGIGLYTEDARVQFDDVTVIGSGVQAFSGGGTITGEGELFGSGSPPPAAPEPRPKYPPAPRVRPRGAGSGWSAHLVGTMTGQVMPEMELLGGSFTDGPLNDATSGTVRVAAAELRQYESWWWSKWSGSVLICYRGHPIVLGPIVEDPRGYTTVDLKFGGLFSILEHRYATDRDYFPGSGVSMAGSVLSLSGTNLGGIAWRLVEAAQDRPNGALPVVLASPTEAGSVNRVRNYQGHNVSNNSVAKLIKEITNVIGGPDVAFRPAWSEPGSRVRWLQYHGTEGMPQIGQEHTFSVDLTAPRSGLTEPELVKESTRYGRAYVTGQGEGPGTEIVIVDGPVLANYPLLETVRSDSQATNANGLLDERGQAAVRAEEIVQLSVNLPADDPVMPVWSWHTGDEFIVRVPGTLLHIDGGVYRMRVVSRSGDLASNRVKVEMQPEAVYG